MDAWLPWLYQYGLGWLLFVASLILALRSGALRLERRIDRLLLTALVAGAAGFAAGHALWIAAVVK